MFGPELGLQAVLRFAQFSVCLEPCCSFCLCLYPPLLSLFSFSFPFFSVSKYLSLLFFLSHFILPCFFHFPVFPLTFLPTCIPSALVSLFLLPSTSLLSFLLFHPLYFFLFHFSLFLSLLFLPPINHFIFPLFLSTVSPPFSLSPP